MPALEKCDALSKRREVVTIVQANMTGDVIISVFTRISLDLKRPALDDGVLRSGSTRARFDEHEVLHAPSDRRDLLAHIASSHVASERHVRPILFLSNVELFAQEIESQLLLDVNQRRRRVTTGETEHARTCPNLDLIEFDLETPASHLRRGADHSLESICGDATEEGECHVNVLDRNRAAAARLHPAAHGSFDRTLLSLGRPERKEQAPSLLAAGTTRKRRGLRHSGSRFRAARARRTSAARTRDRL